MAYSAPLTRLLTGIETFLRSLTDSLDAPLLNDALVTPVELPMTCGRPYALIGAEIATNRSGDVESAAIVNVYLDAILTRDAYLDAFELAWLLACALSYALHRGELADGVHGGSVVTSEFGAQWSANAEADSPPECFYVQLRISPQWLED